MRQDREVLYARGIDDSRWIDDLKTRARRGVAREKL